MRSFARTTATFVNRAGPLTLTVANYPTSENPFDCSGHVIAQFLRSLQRSLDPDNLHLARCDLSGRFAVTSGRLWLPKTQSELERRKSCLHADTLCRRKRSREPFSSDPTAF